MKIKFVLLILLINKKNVLEIVEDMILVVKFVRMMMGVEILKHLHQQISQKENLIVNLGSVLLH